MPLWRLLVHGPASPARNMAIDEALLREIQEPALRLYEWNEPAVSLGYFQAATLAAARPFVRRYTGGGLVDHAHDITYTILLPRAHPWMQLSAPESYATIHRGVQAVLSAAGLATELTSRAAGTDAASCFEKPVRFDLMAGERKISGAAQRRTREGMLHQGSILLADPNCNETVRASFPELFFKHHQFTRQPAELTASESDRAAELEHDRYATEAWNYSR